ncbi:MAG TPA: hypothetical protein IAC81_05920 [Candidatus Scatomorpha stercorigallinarum]|nr:hypothetical protein [Candidatus Scatomorpha stercorigallinarum]
MDKSKNETPNSRNIIAVAMSLSMKFITDTIRKHIEARRKNINLIFSFFMAFSPFLSSDFAARQYLYFTTDAARAQRLSGAFTG